MPAGLPFDVPIDFGDYAPLEGFAELEGTSLAWVEDHGEDGVGLLIWQFRGKPRLEALLRGLLRGVQDAENGVWQVLTERWLDNAIGAQLDGIGRIVDFARAGWDDDTYRQLLRAQILVLRSRSRWQDLAAVLEAVGVTTAAFSEPGIAAIRIVLASPLDGAINGDDVFTLLAGSTRTSSSKRNQRGAKAAGVRLVLEWPIAAVDESFTYGGEPTESASPLGYGSSNDPADGGYYATVRASTETV